MRQRLSAYGPWLAVVLLAASALPLPAAAQAPAVTVFEGARLITGDGGAPIDDSAFVVEGNRITQVGRKGALTVPAGARRVDLTGKTVMPAIVDAHGHPGFLDMVTGTMAKENFTRANYVDHLQRYAYHGVAAVLSTGTDFGELAFRLARGASISPARRSCRQSSTRTVIQVSSTW